MKILFTGASSFTGHWMVRKLADSGHEVIATFTKEGPEQYEGLRRSRIDNLMDKVRPLWNCAFGDQAFLEALEEDIDLLCHHGADVRNYKSPDFDVNAALESNTHNIRNVFEALQQKQCKGVLLTGSVFEQDEGSGGQPLHAFSPYGLSKGFTWQVFRYYAALYGITAGKFVIPNPFGPYEEPRFTNFLMKNWMQDAVPAVKTPAYVRDNIPVTLLADVYTRFAEKVYQTKDASLRVNPSGYVQTQGDFTQRFAEAMRPRIQRDCRFELNEQQEFPEPRVRINYDPAWDWVPGWNESAFWDELAEYYRYNME